MNLKSRFLAVLLVLVPAVVSAEESIAVFPLQELQWEAVGAAPGEYNGTAVLRVSPSQLPDSISRVEIQLYGSAVDGELNCLLSDWPLQISASIGNSTPDQAWSGETNVGATWASHLMGDFMDVRGPFDGLLDVLHVGEVEILFSGAGAPVAPECQEVVAYPSGTLDAAYIWIEGEYPVSITESTWGSVKGLFR